MGGPASGPDKSVDMEVNARKILAQKGLESFIQDLEKHGIGTLAQMRELTKEQLAEWGFPFGARVKIVRAFEELPADEATPATESTSDAPDLTSANASAGGADDKSDLAVNDSETPSGNDEGDMASQEPVVDGQDAVVSISASETPAPEDSATKDAPGEATAPASPGASGGEMLTTIDDLLKKVGLEDKRAKFEELGAAELNDIAVLEDEDLEFCGLNQGEIKAIRAALISNSSPSDIEAMI